MSRIYSSLDSAHYENHERAVTQQRVDTQTEDDEEIVDDWHLDMNFHVFSNHTLQYISSANTRLLTLECVESLTPVDMMNLANGEHDATGHRVWMGAFLLLDALGVLSKDYFGGKRVLELGCGTGIGGIALLCVNDKDLRPNYVLMTDADPDALQVCERNCHHNQLLHESSYRILPLTWGPPFPDERIKASFDTALATDVLYDIASLQPLLDTAHAALKDNGIFVLAHVPRACYSAEHPPVDNLDQYIVQQAQCSGFGLQKKILPNELPPEYRSEGSLNESISLNHMHEMGASLFVFLKEPLE